MFKISKSFYFFCFWIWWPISAEYFRSGEVDLATFGLLRNQKLPSLALSLSSGQRHQKSYFGVVVFLLQNFPNVVQKYEFVTKNVKMIYPSSVHAWLMKPKTEAQFKFLATRNVTGWYQLSSQQVNFDRLSRLWFSFYLFIRIFDQLICLQSLI